MNLTVAASSSAVNLKDESLKTCDSRTALITGGARRIGAEISRCLHKQGYRVIIHYRHSGTEANRLAAELNTLRPDSAYTIAADLNDMTAVSERVRQLQTDFGELDLLINNASSFYPTPLAHSDQSQWDDLINSNLRAAYFLTAAFSDDLKKRSGAVINIIDVHAQRGLTGYAIYSIAKAGLEMMTKVLAKELAPQVRINGVAPGPILWPEDQAAISEEEQQAILQKTPLARSGTAGDIADAVAYLAGAQFITGQILAVDGGRGLYS
ncbi:MAG: pteridine reductase [Pontibacterium sp.]